MEQPLENLSRAVLEICRVGVTLGRHLCHEEQLKSLCEVGMK